jgi:hypothetical protein
MGSGMGYLTFSIHNHLSRFFDIETIGIEARPALVGQTNKIALNLGQDFQNLKFIEGNIQDYYNLNLNKKNENVEILENVLGNDLEINLETKIKKVLMESNTDLSEENKMDVLIALHACDTATDDAIWAGIRGGASIIVTAPCCQKQIRKQLDRYVESKEIDGNNKDGVLEILQHGIYREREAEMITDTVRSLLLEYCGYTTTVFEFIGGEHTAKNVMIAAVKREEKSSRKILKSTERLKKKNKFQSVSVNSFGDVDVDSYKSADDEDELNDINDINDMHDNNDRIYQLAEREREEAIYSRIKNLMSSFGIKQHKLLSLIMNIKGEKGEDPRDMSGVSRVIGEDPEKAEKEADAIRIEMKAEKRAMKSEKFSLEKSEKSSKKSVNKVDNEKNEKKVKKVIESVDYNDFNINRDSGKKESELSYVEEVEKVVKDDRSYTKLNKRPLKLKKFRE